MHAQATRRELFNRLSGVRTPIRPPWAVLEGAFTEICDPCGRCISACPTKIIKAGRAGYPVVDFTNGACTFCGACADACPEHVFAENREAASGFAHKASVGNSCIENTGISCRLCESWCEEGAIRFRPKIGGVSEVLIDEDNCTGCGACVGPCPAKAISMDFAPAENREELVS